MDFKCIVKCLSSFFIFVILLFITLLLLLELLYMYLVNGHNI